MKTIDLFQVITMLFILIGVIGGILFWLKNLLGDVNTQVTGVWVNGENTFKVLIYSIDSNLQGDVVWAHPQSQNILGAPVLEDMKLRFFIFGKGSYTDPFTGKKTMFRLRFLSRNSIQLYFTDAEGNMISQETWNLVA